MPASINGIPYILGADPARDYPSTSKGLAEWIDGNTVRPTDPRLTNARPPTSHSHTITQVSGLQTALNGKVATTDPRLTDARNPTSHQHALADVTDLQAALDAKVDGTDPRLTDARTPTAHTHPVSDVTGLGSILDSLTYTSGLRKLNELVPSRIDGDVYVYRTGPTVTFMLYGLRIRELGTMLTLPAGLRPPYTLPMSNDTNFALGVRFLFFANGSVNAYGSSIPNSALWGTFTFGTLNAPPTTPPWIPLLIERTPPHG